MLSVKYCLYFQFWEFITGSNGNPLIDIVLYNHHVSSCHCKYVLVTSENEKVSIIPFIKRNLYIDTQHIQLVVWSKKQQTELSIPQWVLKQHNNGLLISHLPIKIYNFARILPICHIKRKHGLDIGYKNKACLTYGKCYIS